ncbi:MAG TPA: antiviral reverse transcriptase Drt3b, partial [Chryseobacterium sp.]
ITMKKKKKVFRYTKERVVLSDVLPYEVPIIFSNRHFYKFLSNNKIELDNDKLLYTNSFTGSDATAFNELLKILFDNTQFVATKNSITIEPKFGLKKLPYQYKILHKGTDFRTLSVPHPLNQLSVIEFYNKYKELIIYYGKQSSYSIRKPAAVARFVFFNDRLHDSNKGNKDDFLELTGKEYDNLKTFFSYKKYPNIYRFYEDYRYQRAEKKFDILYKFDISKCFDSIYSHSIVWALMNKEIVKYNIKASKSTFGGQFDTLMQNINFGETNGIVIGPEVSRIFAELILQKIDKNVETKLKDERGCIIRKDYEIYRYVDDYFLFCDKENIKEDIIELFRHELKHFKLSLNDNKSKPYSKPMITEITMAKQKINHLFENLPIFRIKDADQLITKNSDEEKHVIRLINDQFYFYIQSNKLAARFKAIVKESNVEYKDILNYTFSVLNNKIEYILVKFDEYFEGYTKLESLGKLDKRDLIRKAKLETRFTEFIVGFTDFVFFLYTVSPRVNTTIKLCHIMSKIIKYYQGKYKINKLGELLTVSRFIENNQDLVFKKIVDDTSLVLSKHRITKHTQIEHLYLFILLRDLGKQYRLEPIVLERYFQIDDFRTKGIEINHLNYFCVTSLLFYIGNIKIYDEIKTALKVYIKLCISEIDEDKRKVNCELVMLLLDLIVCPYLDNNFKTELLSLFGVNSADSGSILNFRKHQKYWFVKWENFNLAKELNSKVSEEVYS